VAHVCDVVKASCPKSSVVKRPSPVRVGVVPMIIMPCGYNGPNAQERSEAKVSRSAEGEAEAGSAMAPSTAT
jgi:hypothetical protein